MNDPSGGQAGHDAAHPLPGGEGSEPAEHDASRSWTALPSSKLRGRAQNPLRE
jgi:hypothetical protein